MHNSHAQIKTCGDLHPGDIILSRRSKEHAVNQIIIGIKRKPSMRHQVVEEEMLTIYALTFTKNFDVTFEQVESM